MLWLLVPRWSQTRYWWIGCGLNNNWNGPDRSESVVGDSHTDCGVTFTLTNYGPGTTVRSWSR